MTEALLDFLPEDRQLFGPVDSVGAALREIARVMAPANTSKFLQRRWGIDPSTAENVASKGVASATTLAKAVGAERERGVAWDLWDALGELLIGESRDEHDERRLQLLLAETQLAKQRLEDRKARRAALEARTWGLPEVGPRESA